VMEYSRRRAVADGVNVDGQVYRIRTQIGEQGSQVEAGYYLEKRDKQTRRARWERLDEEFSYDAAKLDRDVVSESQIRTVIRTYRDKLFTDLFPGRTTVPKTLVFAKDDSHAENIVRIVREEFGKGNDFCKKITYRVTGVNPEDLIAAFRNSYDPRIAVTVDMIATGTDIKPLEVLLFMRPVRSRVLFEQMLGRGTRIINPSDLQGVTPDAGFKDHFVIVDAVGVVEAAKLDTQSLERKRSLPFDKLLSQVALGARDEDTLLSLAGRLGRLERTLSPQDVYAIGAVSGGRTLKELANALLDAVDPDAWSAYAVGASLAPGPDDGLVGAGPAPALDRQPNPDLAAAQTHLINAAASPFDHAPLRSTLSAIQQRSEQTIDHVSIDAVREAGFSAADTERARSVVASFKQFIADNRDELAALQLIFNQPFGKRALTFQQVKELAERLQLPPNVLTTEAVWSAYARIEKDKVRGAGGRRVLTDVIALVRHVVHPDEALEPYPARVQSRYHDWLAAQLAGGRAFSVEQRWWLDKIAENIGVNVTVEPDDLNAIGDFADRGGPFAMAQIFGKDWRGILEELNGVLAG
jgi:type I restriction enzyme, R subunit